MKIGESHSYTIIYHERYQNAEKTISFEVTATSGVFPTIYRTVEKNSELIIKDAVFVKRISEPEILRLAISVFDELKEKYILTDN